MGQGQQLCITLVRIQSERDQKVISTEFMDL
jgi:hypothetical protein